jgi:ubiquinone/menaquinone biosynthesis C-methylase UbiE
MINSIEATNLETKKAWGENWKNISMSEVLGIFEYTRVKKILETIKPFLPAKGTIIEAGCGLGPWVIKLSELGYNMVGVDYQEECINRIKAHDKKQKVYTADIKSIPFGDSSFSAYLSWGVIEHFAEGPDAALLEAYRVLENNGRLLLSVPYKNIFLKIKEPIINLKRNPFVRKLFKKPEKVYYYQKYFKLNELKEIISRNGFIVEKIIPVDHIFSLVEFSVIFRNRKVYDGENALAVIGGALLEKLMPWSGAGSILVVAHKEGKS